MTLLGKDCLKKTKPCTVDAERSSPHVKNHRRFIVAQHPTHCCQCGTRYPSTKLWPKTCQSCGHQVWSNPLPVSIVLCGTEDRLLLVRRNIAPGLGLWALPGGYVNHRETPEMGGSRELREETERTATIEGNTQVVHPGLAFSPEQLEHFTTIGHTEINLILMFYRVQNAERQLDSWWNRVEGLHTEGTPWNSEVQSLILVSREEIARLTIAFSTHLDAIHRWFSRSRTRIPSS